MFLTYFFEKFLFWLLQTPSKDLQNAKMRCQVNGADGEKGRRRHLEEVYQWEAPGYRSDTMRRVETWRTDDYTIRYLGEVHQR